VRGEVSIDPKILRQNVSLGQRFSDYAHFSFLSFFVLFFQCAVKYPSIHFLIGKTFPEASVLRLCAFFFFLFLCYFFSARYRSIDPKILRQNVFRGQRSPIMRIFFLSFFVLFFQCAVKYPSMHAASFEAPGKPRDY